MTAGMELSPGEPSFLDMRNAILEADVVSGRREQRRPPVGGVRRARHRLFAAAVGSRDTRPAESFSLPPGAAAHGNDGGHVLTEAGAPVPARA